MFRASHPGMAAQDVRQRVDFLWRALRDEVTNGQESNNRRVRCQLNL
jgi:hypothetical protein